MQAINTKNDYTPAYYGLAKIYKKADNFPQAIKTYQVLLSYHPEELEAQTLMGLCHKKTGDYEKARDVFRYVIEKDPKYDYAARSLKKLRI